MKTEEFFTRVIAPVGNLVIAALRGRNFWNVGNFDAAGAASKIAQLDVDPNITVYFAVGTHENNTDGTKVTRRKATAAWFKALALDLDCGPDKPYPTQKDGAVALYTALAAFGFPDPLLVSSGNGLHAYWPFQKEISAAHWEKMSIALRLALAQHSVQIDVSKIHDASMVLRPVGTQHKKQTPWKPVEVLVDCPDYDVLMLASKLQQWAGKVVNSTKLSPSKTLSPISAAILGGGFDPLNLDTVSLGCRQIAALLASGGATDAAGADVREPLWRASLGIAKYADNQQDAVVRLCGQHPDYDLQDNLNKLAGWRGTGPTTCAEFEKHCPTGCVGCPSKDVIKSPAQLSVQTQVVIPSVPAPLSLPPGYCLWRDKVYQEVEEEDENGQMKMKRELVCERPLIVLGRYTNHENAEACLRWSFKQPMAAEWHTHDMSTGLLAMGGSELVKYFGDKDLVISNPTMLNRLKTYMIDFLKYQQQTSESGLSMEAYGWQKNGAFLCGDRLINNGGATVPWRASKALISIADSVGIRGDRATWADMTKLLDTPDAAIHAFSMLVAGSGLLLPGSGIQSYVYSLYSVDTGTGKSLSLQLGNSLFGHPIELMLQASDTENALYKTMGSMGSLSAAMDEITKMKDRAAGFAFQAQTGREKKRLQSDAAMREPSHWHAPLRLSTNASVLDMYHAQRLHNDAEQVRTLELQLDNKRWVSGQNVRDLLRLLADNYGFAAPEIAAAILQAGSLRQVYDRAEKKFRQEFPSFAFEGDERFYAGGVISAYGVGCIGRNLGLFQFNIEHCVDMVLTQIENLRARRVATRRDCFDSIEQFLTEHQRCILTVHEDRTTTVSKQVAQSPYPQEVYVRVEIVSAQGQPTPGAGSRLIINIPRLRKWANDQEDFSGLVSQLKDAGAVLKEKERVTLNKGVIGVSPVQPQCLVLDLCHPALATGLSGSKPVAPTNATFAILQGGKP